MKPPSSAKVKDDVDHEESEMEEGNSEDEVDDSTLKRKLQEDSEDDDDEDVDRLDNDDYDLLEENTGIRFKKVSDKLEFIYVMKKWLILIMNNLR